MGERDRPVRQGGERGGVRDIDEGAGRSAAFRGGEDASQRGPREPGRGGSGQGGRGEFGGYPGGRGERDAGYGHGGGAQERSRGGGHGGAGQAWQGSGAHDGGRGWSGTGQGEPGGRRGRPGPGRHWADEAWSDASWSERDRGGGGERAGYTGPSETGWRSGAGYGSGYGSGYGAGAVAGGDDRGSPSRWGSGGAVGWGGGMTGAAQGRNRGPKGWQRSDERIHDDVCERLSAERDVDPSEVTVQVSAGTVTLTGSVSDRVMKYRIEDVVDGCSGVRDVDNRLRVNRGGLGTATDTGGGRAGPGDDPRREPGGSRGSLLGRLFGFSGGTKLSDIMTRDPRTVGPDEPIRKVAQLMKELDVGAIPVCTGRTLNGMVTDRDIAIRVVAAGGKPDTAKASEVMTSDVHTCREDEDVESALDKMGDLQVRRIPVVDGSGQLVGIVSLGDFAQRDTGDVEDALQDISARRG
jgi:CBS domain-containing protein